MKLFYKGRFVYIAINESRALSSNAIGEAPYSKYKVNDSGRK